MSSCASCSSNPCHWDYYRNGILAYIEEKGKGQANNEKRKAAYKFYVFKVHGPLGSSRRVEVPSCILNGVRAQWPETNPEDYMGHKDE